MMLIILIAALVLGWLFGLWLNKQAYDELKAGRKWFLAIMALCGMLIILSALFLRGAEGFESLVGALVFLGTVAFSSYRKSGKR